MRENSKLVHSVLVTGGAGFIGSNLVETLLNRDDVGLVRVLDDLSTGYWENIQDFVDHPKYQFIEGSITDYNTCEKAIKGITRVSHQAALGSVPRSIENPIRTINVNVNGTLNVLNASREMGVERVVLAFSSSTYGDSKEIPKVEERIGKPLSPYAASKVMCEHLAHVYNKTYGLDYIGLRYFNIFGPRQNPDNPYAAVIPIFCKSFIKDQSISINGDGETSRDFTYVKNAVFANELALFTDNESALNEIYNVACGQQTSLNEMVRALEVISGKKVEVNYKEERRGDVKYSLADISKISNKLGYSPCVNFEEGLDAVYAWYQEHH